MSIGPSGLFPGIADSANALLAGEDMAAGNIRLSGWWLAPDNYWGLDEALIAVVYALTHNAALTLRLVPAINLECLAGCIIALLLRQNFWQRLFVAGAFILIPAIHGEILYFLFLAPFHVLTAACIMLSIWLSARILDGTSRRYPCLLLLVLVVIDASASDPLFYYLGCIPMVLALIAVQTVSWTQRAKIILLIILSAYLGHLIPDLNERHGGFFYWRLGDRFNLGAGAMVSLLRLGQTILQSLGAWPGQGDFLGAVIRLPLLAAAIIPVCGIGLAWLRHFKTPVRPAPVFIDLALLLVICADLGAMWVQSVNPDGADARFLLPAWAAAAALAARFYKPAGYKICYFLVIAGIAFGADVMMIIKQPAGDLFKGHLKTLVTVLEQNDVKYGYATYTLAGPLTVLSDGELNILGVVNLAKPPASLTGHQNLVFPYTWFARSNWYQKTIDTPDFFCITDADDASLSPVLLVKAFGVPRQVIRQGGYTILIFAGPRPPLL